jgi:hypothetical protein
MEKLNNILSIILIILFIVNFTQNKKSNLYVKMKRDIKGGLGLGLKGWACMPSTNIKPLCV